MKRNNISTAVDEPHSKKLYIDMSGNDQDKIDLNAHSTGVSQFQFQNHHQLKCSVDNDEWISGAARKQNDDNEDAAFSFYPIILEPKGGRISVKMCKTCQDLNFKDGKKFCEKNDRVLCKFSLCKSCVVGNAKRLSAFEDKLDAVKNEVDVQVAPNQFWKLMKVDYGTMCLNMCHDCEEHNKECRAEKYSFKDMRFNFIVSLCKPCVSAGIFNTDITSKMFPYVKST